MNKMMRLKEILVVLSLLTLSSSAFSSTLQCPGVLSPGNYVGHFIDVIDMDGFKGTNYLFRPENGRDGCVQYTFNDNQARYNIIMNAFLLNHKISLSVGRDHFITGIGYRNDE